MLMRREHDLDQVYPVRGPRLRTAGKLGLILLVVGIGPWAYSAVRLHWHNWGPLLVNASLISKQFDTPSFKLDFSGIYDVSLVFPRPRDEHRLDCMTGESFGHECDAIPRTLYLRWMVLDDNGTVRSSAVYKPSGFYGSSDEFGVDLGAFDAKKGHVYRLRLNPEPQSASVQFAHPKLSVYAARIYWEKWIIAAQAGFFLAVFFGSIGALLITLDLLTLCLQRRGLHNGAADKSQS